MNEFFLCVFLLFFLPLPAQLLKLQTSLYSSREEEPDRMLLQNNYRSTQPPNTRVVLTSFSEG